ncbi:MAG TPA: GH-E family nuclease, partial [Myxococcales bacterium]|nr:GH-E family nuclease [Myxococcales bacterium]
PSLHPIPTIPINSPAEAGGDEIATTIQIVTGLVGLLKKAPALLGKLGAVAGATGDAALAGDAARLESAVAGTEKAVATTEKAVANTEKAVASTEKAAGTATEAGKGEQAAAKGEQAAAQPGKNGAKVTKAPMSLREKYMGRTPGKGRPTGQKVIARETAAGTVREGPNGLEFQSKVDGQWYPINQADMAHNVDAVKWWNETGRFYGPQSPEVRQWMLDPNNYHLEHFSINRSLGAQLGTTYLPPVPHP